MARRTWFLSCVITLLTISIVLLVGCQRMQPAASFQPEVLPLPPQLTTYEPMTIPADNPMTAEKVALGRQLFFDERLSGDGSKILLLVSRLREGTYRRPGQITRGI